jgi:ribonuclease P protein component
MIRLPETIPKEKKEGYPKSLRVKKDSEFRQIMNEGIKKRGDNLIVFRLPRGAEVGQKFGIKIGKGIKKATERNKIKRIIREVLRKNKDRFDENESVVVLVKSAAEEINLHKLKEELVSLIQ